MYEAGASGGSGGGGTPSLSDLDNPGFKPGDGTPTPEELAKKAQEQADAAAYDALVKEAKNEDGSLKPGYKEVDGKVVKDPDYKPADDQNAGDGGDGAAAEDEGDFWADVDKLHGQEFKIEYPEGVDPVSPEGAYHREKAIMDIAVANFEQYLKKSDPRAYAYMLHRQEGGNDEEFFSNKTISLPEYETFKESAELQANVYKSSLINSGLDPETAQIVVDKAIKDGKLFDKADATYKKTEEDHAKELKRIEDANREAEQRYQSSVNKLNQSLTVVINEGKGLGIIIPDTEKAPFSQFVKSRVEYDAEKGKFLFVLPISDEDLPKQLESLYLLNKKGNLKELIVREAQSQNVKRLKRTIDKSRQSQNSGGGDGGGGNKIVALGDL